MIDTLFSWLYDIVSWIMIGWHWVLSPLFGADSGLTWTLSIVGLVVVIRTLLIPLFVRQIKASRAMQVLSPQMKEIQKKYGHDRERMSQELMKLYKDTGTNPFSSCLPILLQAPIFFALFRVLDGIANDERRGAFASHPDLFSSAQQADFFGIPKVEVIDRFIGAANTQTQIVAIALVALMTLTTYTTQRQLMRKNMPATAMEGQFAQQQKILLYVLPVMFAVSGVYFPLGVVLYWCVSNAWSMGQQFYVIRRMPAPGTPAEEAYRRRLAAKAQRRGDTPQPVTAPPATAAGATVAEPAAQRPEGRTVRKQPKRQTREQRRRNGRQ